MKKIIIIFILIFISHLIAEVTGFEDEFGFTIDKPEHGEYYFRHKLLTIEKDGSIKKLMPKTFHNRSQVDLKYDSNDFHEYLEEAKYSVTTAVFQEYDLYSQPEITKPENIYNSYLNFVPVTGATKLDRENIETQLDSFAFQIDDVFLKTSTISQQGTIEFKLIITKKGIEVTDYFIGKNSRFSSTFINDAAKLITSWNITSENPVQCKLIRNYLR